MYKLLIYPIVCIVTGQARYFNVSYLKVKDAHSMIYSKFIHLVGEKKSLIHTKGPNSDTILNNYSLL